MKLKGLKKQVREFLRTANRGLKSYGGIPRSKRRRRR